MINNGLFIWQQKIWQGDTEGYSYFGCVYRVQKKVTFLGIPLYVKNLKSFGSIEDAVLYTRNLK